MKKLIALLVALASAQMGFGQPAAKLGEGRRYTSVQRLELDRLRAVHEDRLRYARARRAVRLRTRYRDLRAILHAHAEDSPHTGGTRAEMLTDARRAGVHVIMLSDHRQPDRDFIDDSWRGLRDGVLFIPGAEAEGFLLYPRASIQKRKPVLREDWARLTRETGGNVFLSHVEERLDHPMAGLDGLEIYNHHTDVKDEAEFNLWLRGALTDPVRLRHLEQALALYPVEVFAAQQDYLAPIIAKWDRDTRSQRLTGVAANDCHHNQVLTVTALDDAIEIGFITSRPTTARITKEQVSTVAALLEGRKPGERIARLDLDPYERSFRYVTTHLLAERLDEESVRAALAAGRAYVAHDFLCDPTGFAFVAADRGGRVRAVMGDEVKLEAGLALRVEAPVACWFRLFRDGEVVHTSEGRELRFDVDGPGVYRLEAWLAAGGERRPWVYANPIYVR